MFSVKAIFFLLRKRLSERPIISVKVSESELQIFAPRKDKNQKIIKFSARLLSSCL